MAKGCRYIYIYIYDKELAGDFLKYGNTFCDIYRKSDRTKSALDLIDLALQKNIDTPWAYRQLSLISLENEKIWAAISHAKTAYDLDMNDRWITEHYVSLLFRVNALDKAHDIITNALSHNNERSWVNQLAAMYQAKKGDYKKALEFSEYALKLCPTDNNIIWWNDHIKKWLLNNNEVKK